MDRDGTRRFSVLAVDDKREWATLVEILDGGPGGPAWRCPMGLLPESVSEGDALSVALSQFSVDRSVSVTLSIVVERRPATASDAGPTGQVKL